MKPPTGVFQRCSWEQERNCSVGHLKIRLVEEFVSWDCLLSPQTGCHLWSPDGFTGQRWVITVRPVWTGVLESSMLSVFGSSSSGVMILTAGMRWSSSFKLNFKWSSNGGWSAYCLSVFSSGFSPPAPSRSLSQLISAPSLKLSAKRKIEENLFCLNL